MRWAGGELPDLVGDLFGTRPIASARVAGGDINNAYKVRLANGTTVFVKSRPDAAPGWYASEADGLTWLRETSTVRVPDVLAVHDDAERVHRFLVLDWIESAPAAFDHDEQLGRALAELHRFGCSRFGFHHDNWIASIPQANAPMPTWAEFYAHRRLEPLVRRAVDDGALPATVVDRFDVLYNHLEELVGPPEPPARLHGDLWRGNAITDARGGPVLIDPSVYGGHREMDLAMMALFGGFGRTVGHAYDEVHPRADGHQRRLALYQLYPLLVHTILFGGSYATAVSRGLDQYVP